MNFIYPGNFKDPKMFLRFRIFDLIGLFVLIIICVVYSAQNYSFVPMIFPSLFFILKVRFLEDGSNIWEKILDVFNYLVNSQQVYYWGIRRKYAKNKK